jgi:hypothetical protein
MRSWPSTPSEAGFTLLETLIAMLCALAVIWAFWAFGGRVIGALLSSSAEAGIGARAALVDRGIRAAAARVEPSFWAKPPEPAQGGGSAIEFAYLDGDADKKISLRYDSGKLIIDTGGSSMSFRIDKLLSLKPILSAAGAATGIEAAYLIGKRTFVSRAAFASLSLVSPGAAP